MERHIQSEVPVLFYTHGMAVVKMLGPLRLIASSLVPKCLRYETAERLKKASADIILGLSIIFSALTMRSRGRNCLHITGSTQTVLRQLIPTRVGAKQQRVVRPSVIQRPAHFKLSAAN